jgi:hypothetical protein
VAGTGPRRQSDGAALGCRAFPRPTRRSPPHSRATPAGGVHGALRTVCGMPPKRRGRPTTAASVAEGAATLSLQSDAGQATNDDACARLPPRPLLHACALSRQLRSSHGGGAGGAAAADVPNTTCA